MTHGPVDEGVIKFHARHREAPLSSARFGDLVALLSAWREIFVALGVIGEDPGRYGGAGFGNLSGRIEPFPGLEGARPFLVTGTQTGGRSCMRLDDYCVVEHYDAATNSVDSYGPILPSSESLTHGALYDLSPDVRFVFHAHAPLLFARADALSLPATSPDVAYGTPEMAREVTRLYRETALAETRVLVMGGHEDGVVSFGRTAEEAGQALLRELVRALEGEHRDRGRLDRGASVRSG